LNEKPTITQVIASEPNITARPTQKTATSLILSIEESVCAWLNCPEGRLFPASKFPAIHPGCVEIQVMPACKWRLSALPVLMYSNVRSAPVLEIHHLVAARPSSIPARPDLNLNTPCRGIVSYCSLKTLAIPA
jgi:hypothetical protein